ncbi:MAG: hypothetical protein HY807_06310 [Nitrospirae bacterium]|nr:hypothetical protein [Nitrospirota bacterium]
MPLSLNEIRDRALAFSREWEGANAERVAFLFELYHKYTSLLPAPEKPKQRRRKRT